MARLRRTHAEFIRIVEKNRGNEYTVLSQYKGSKEHVIVRHNVCGHEYPIVPEGLVRGKICNKCKPVIVAKKSIEKAKNKFLDFLQNERQGEFKLISEYVTQRDDVVLYHTVCGDSFNTRPDKFLDGAVCKVCRESKGEQKIRHWLQKLDVTFESQKVFMDCVYKKHLRFDFYVDNAILIEFDGKQHHEVVEYFGGDDVFRETQRRDAIKTQYCADNGIPLIRIPYWDFDNIDAILTEKLLPLLDASSTQNRVS